jgi:hypothetical protein
LFYWFSQTTLYHKIWSVTHLRNQLNDMHGVGCISCLKHELQSTHCHVNVVHHNIKVINYTLLEEKYR